MLALTRHVPCAVPGIFFLSGGQSEEMSTDNLRAVNQDTGYARPWQTSFCFGRALQDSCRSTWLGNKDSLDSTPPSEAPDSRFRDALDVIPENLPMPLCTTLSQAFTSFSASRHFVRSLL